MEIQKVAKQIILVVLFCCLIQGVVAYNAGEPYSVFNISKCYGPVILKIRGASPFLENEYGIDNFKKTGTEKKDDIWEYNCNNKNGQKLDIVLETNPSTTNSYDIRLEYYIAPYNSDGDITTEGPNEAEMENENNRRNEVFTNIQFGPQPIKEEPFKWPEFPGGSVGKWGVVIVIVLIVLFLLLGGGYIFWKVFFKSDDTIISEPTLSGNMKEPTEEEVLEYIRNNT